MCVELKIKSKHLTAEAKIIRFEEQKIRRKDKEKFVSLRDHRRWEVRNENRATYLARAFLDGKTYETVEKNVKDTVKRNAYILPRVLTMVNKYGSVKLSQTDINDWVTG